MTFGAFILKLNKINSIEGNFFINQADLLSRCSLRWLAGGCVVRLQRLRLAGLRAGNFKLLKFEIQISFDIMILCDKKLRGNQPK